MKYVFWCYFNIYSEIWSVIVIEYMIYCFIYDPLCCKFYIFVYEIFSFFLSPMSVAPWYRNEENYRLICVSLGISTWIFLLSPVIRNSSGDTEQTERISGWNWETSGEPDHQSATNYQDGALLRRALHAIWWGMIFMPSMSNRLRLCLWPRILNVIKITYC